jgi:hypothetical protein
MRLRTERADKSRALRVRNSFHYNRPTGLAQLVEHRLQRNDGSPATRADRLYAWLQGGRLRCTPLDRGALGRTSRSRALGRTLCATPPSCPPTAAASRSSCSCRSHDFHSRRAAMPSRPGLGTFPLRITCGAERSACPCACCDASSCLMSGRPTESADDCPLRGLHRHRAGDRPGSSPRRVPSA